MNLSLTEEQKKLYLAFYGGRCPVCESYDTTVGDYFDYPVFRKYKFSQQAECNKCGARWLDIYELRDMEFIDYGDKDYV